MDAWIESFQRTHWDKMTMRQRNWEQLLNDFYLRHAHTPFEWGTFDCVLMCGLWADLCTGRSDAQQWVGKYSSRKEAYDLLADGYGFGFDAVFDRYYKQVRTQMVWTGDVVLVTKATGEQAYAIKHCGSVLMAGKSGVLVIPLRDLKIDKAWRVE